MIELRPTVKRDLTLWSVLAWEKGYQVYLKDKLGWSYPVLFWYDGVKVNFYHHINDFAYFKEVVIRKLLDDNELFARLNKDFLQQVAELKNRLSRPIAEEDLKGLSNLVGEVMSFYIFVVSDAFVKARPEAFASRLESQSVLYELDERAERLLGHTRLPGESEQEVWSRRQGYIVEDGKVILGVQFADYCQEHSLYNPEQRLAVGQSELRGDIACKGKAQGRVRLLLTKDDMPRVVAGDIVVSVMTNASYLSVLSKAGAILTDEGGVTCHAAITSRELGIPCIVGIKVATHVLKDGDMIEVDADKGLVTILTRA